MKTALSASYGYLKSAPKWYMDWVLGRCPDKMEIPKEVKALLEALSDKKWHETCEEFGTDDMDLIEACLDLELIKFRKAGIKAKLKKGKGAFIKLKITKSGLEVLERGTFFTEPETFFFSDSCEGCGYRDCTGMSQGKACGNWVPPEE